MTVIHDDVRAALDEIQDELVDIEKVAGHELVRLYDALRATTQAIRAARIDPAVALPEIRAGAGAITDPLHPPAPEPPAPAEPVDQPAETAPDQPVAVEPAPESAAPAAEPTPEPEPESKPKRARGRAA